MKAIVKLENGKYYLSKVFGVFNDNLTNELKAGFNYYYIIFDEDMKTLISKYEYKNIIPEIFVIMINQICKLTKMIVEK